MWRRRREVMEYFAFQWHITDTCDQRCEHCYIFSEGHPKLVSISMNNAAKVIDNCVEMCRKMDRLPYLYITGGDPILHPHFWEILELVHQSQIPFTLMGNPFHLTVDVCRRFKALGCQKYQLSIDGKRETHDSIRKPGSFDATLKAIDILHAAGVRVAIMSTVSGTNINEFEEIIDTVVDKKVEIFAFGRYCPTSREKAISEKTHIEPLEYKAFLQRVWNKFDQYKECGTAFNLKDHLWTLFLYEKGLFSIPDVLDKDGIYDGCNCTNCHMTITPTGEVMACRRFDSPVGNAFKESLHSIYEGPKMDYYRQFGKFEKCSKCELLRFCRGCPAVAYGYNHDFYSPDPQCWKEV